MRRNNDVNGKPVIVLSRRNILAMLHKLDMPGSHKTFIAPGNAFVVLVEDDDKHYSGRDEGPGEMHPETEVFIKAKGGIGHGKKTL